MTRKVPPVVAPQVEGTPQLTAQLWNRIGEDDDVDVLVRARHSGEGLDRLAAHHPPRLGEPVHDLTELRDRHRVPGAIHVEESAAVLLDVRRTRLGHSASIGTPGSTVEA
jgi:hypothetical protein